MAKVVVNGEALREIMRNENSQRLVNEVAERICDTANSEMSETLKAADDAGGYVVHPRVLDVSAHAFVDCTGFATVIDNNKHATLKKAFWANQGE